MSDGNLESAQPRFRFGDNWLRFAESIDERHLEESVRGLRSSLHTESLEGRSFLDIGCGSGLHSLAALKLGATSITSFDYDEDSVSCTSALRERAGAPAHWRVMRGSILDSTFIGTELEPSDDVYSWGVLHHTGAMWNAIRNASSLARPRGGRLLIGIYNEKRPGTDVMRVLKRAYVVSPPVLKGTLKWSYWLLTTAAQAARGRNVVAEVRGRIGERGMNYWRDLEDWVGGYPYECATPAAVERFVCPLGFRLAQSRVGDSIASVNEYLFERL